MGNTISFFTTNTDGHHNENRPCVGFGVRLLSWVASLLFAHLLGFAARSAKLEKENDSLKKENVSLKEEVARAYVPSLKKNNKKPKEVALVEIYTLNEEEKQTILQTLEEVRSSTPKDAVAKLFSFCSSDNYQRYSAYRLCILKNRGLDIIALAMDANQHDVGIMSKATEILARLMASYENACFVVQRLGVVQMVLDAMTNNLNDEDMQRAGCGFIGRFILDDISRIQFYASELRGIPYILAAMEQHQDKARVQMVGLSALNSICFHDSDEYAAKILESGGLAAVEAARDNHGDDHPRIKTFAIQIIRALSNEN